MQVLQLMDAENKRNPMRPLDPSIPFENDLIQMGIWMGDDPSRMSIIYGDRAAAPTYPGCQRKCSVLSSCDNPACASNAHMGGGGAHMGGGGGSSTGGGEGDDGCPSE